jgi:HSP20 family protein
MNIVRQRTLEPGWPAFDQLFTLRQELNRFMENPLAELSGQAEFFNDWAPALDVLEDSNNLFVVAELPGMRKEDIDISLQEGVLSITGERQAEDRNEEETYRSERCFGRFHRSVTLPKPVSVDKIKASYKDGVLTVTLPKPEETKPRQIQVAVG